MFKNPVTNLVLGIVVVLWALYSLFGPHEEAQSQGVIILQVVLLICAAAGIVGSALLIAKRNQEAGGGGRAR
jgi:O-antigen/teichoic acid export membrane protein